MEKKLITDAAVVSTIREAMPVATAEDKGLQEASHSAWRNTPNSLLVLRAGNAHLSASLLLSVSTITGGDTSLYFVSVAQSTTGTPAVRVKVLSGEYAPPVVYKRSAEGLLSVYVKRTEFTPVVGALVVSRSNAHVFGLPFETVDNAELEDATEATLEE